MMMMLQMQLPMPMIKMNLALCFAKDTNYLLLFETTAIRSPWCQDKWPGRVSENNISA